MVESIVVKVSSSAEDANMKVLLLSWSYQVRTVHCSASLLPLEVAVPLFDISVFWGHTERCVHAAGRSDPHTHTQRNESERVGYVRDVEPGGLCGFVTSCATKALQPSAKSRVFNLKFHRHTSNTSSDTNARQQEPAHRQQTFFTISFISHVENEILKITKAQKGGSQHLQLLRENEELWQKS